MNQEGAMILGYCHLEQINKYEQNLKLKIVVMHKKGLS